MARNHSFLVAAMRGPVDSVPSPPPSKAAFVETKEARFEYRSISDSSKEVLTFLALKAPILLTSLLTSIEFAEFRS